jgi:translation initiation factor IF-1
VAKQDDTIEMMGVIEEVLPGAMFRVRLENNALVLGHISGRMRKNKIQILMGDRVRCELSVYDLSKTRIIFREK